MSSDAALDAKLTELLRVMVARLPPGKKLPTPVVKQLLQAKYGDTFNEAYIASHDAFITDTIMRCMIEKEKAAMAAAASTAKATGKDNAGSSSSEEEEDSDDEDDDSDDDADDEEESDEEEAEDDDDELSANSDEEDEEEDGSSDGSSPSDSDADADAEEPEKKKARPEVAEAAQAIASKEQQADNGGSVASVAERCKAMAECLRKLSYRVRGPGEAESLEDYLKTFLIVEFEKHGMDPEKYSKADVKRYRIQREVELLQQDGASLHLDRRNRAGRGFSNVAAPKDGAAAAAPASSSQVSNKQSSMFLDDE